jgi:hypothetical protein
MRSHTNYSLLTLLFTVIIACHSMLQAAEPAGARNDPFHILEPSKDLARKKPGTALIHIIRTQEQRVGTPLFLWPRTFWVFANKNLIGVVPDNTYTYAYIKPGEYVFWVSHKNTKGKVSAIRMRVFAGKQYFIHVHPMTAAPRSPRLWIMDEASTKSSLQYVARFRMIKAKLLDKAKQIRDEKYRLAQSKATRYPYTIVGNAPYISHFYRREKFRKKTFTYYQADRARPSPEVKNNKALVYVITRDLKNIQLDRKVLSAWTFADKELLTVTWRGKYGYAYVEPGDHVFWSLYFWLGLNYDISAVKMRVAAGKTYYMELNLRPGKRRAMGPKIVITKRVVPPAIGKHIVRRTRYHATIRAKAKRKSAKLVRKYYARALAKSRRHVPRKFDSRYLVKTTSPTTSAPQKSVSSSSWLSKTEIIRLFSGNTSISDSEVRDRRYITYYEPNGDLRQDRNGTRLKGKWWVNEDGQHCIQKVRPSSGKLIGTYCRLVRKENGIYKRYKRRRSGGLKHVQTYKSIKRGNPHKL